MDHALLILVFLIGVALLFDFLNGLHDAANSIATVVATRLLGPVQAVAFAAFFNFAAYFLSVIFPDRSVRAALLYTATAELFELAP